MVEVNEQNLLNNGYRKHSQTHNHADYLFQKRIYDGETLIFWSNVYQYLRLANGEESYSAEIQFHLDDGKVCDVTLGNYKTIDEIEEFGRKFFKAFDCIADE